MSFHNAKAVLGGANWYYSTLSFNLTKEFVFKDFKQAWNFLRLLAFQRDIIASNDLNYEFTNVYNKVNFRVPINNLSTVQIIENVHKYHTDGHFKINKF